MVTEQQHPEVCAAGTGGGMKAWRGTWAAGGRGADRQVQVGRRFASHRAQLRHSTVGGFLEPFENPVLGRLFVSPRGARFKGSRGGAAQPLPSTQQYLPLACGGAKPLEPQWAGGRRGLGGRRGVTELDHPVPSAPSAWRLPAADLPPHLLDPSRDGKRLGRVRK